METQQQHVWFVCVLHQVRRQQPGAAGGGRLHDRLPQRSDAPPEDARHRLAEEMLPDDRQKVRMTQQFWRQTSWNINHVRMNAVQTFQTEEESQVSHHRSPHVVHQDRFGHLETVYKVISAEHASLVFLQYRMIYSYACLNNLSNKNTMKTNY